ncbi:MAG: hypothetical protein MJ230_05555, partial [bacterium]|nr:hypothetical protein [bacterium]
MTVIEKIVEINDVLKGIKNRTIFTFQSRKCSKKNLTNERKKKEKDMEYLNSNFESTSQENDFNEYLATLGAKNLSLNQMEKVFLPYIFERNIDGKSILQMFKENGCQNEEIVDGFIKSVSFVFE